MWRKQALDELARQPVCGYRPSATPHSEPTALAALALQSHGLTQEAAKAGRWLANCQSNDGSLGVSHTEQRPSWPTSLAVLAWRALGSGWSYPADRAVRWIISVRGDTTENTGNLVGHDTQIPGWSWVQGTHSWVEPTALNVIALKASQHFDHERCITGVRMLIDRLLPGGGCNYGNTVVLGQVLRPQMMPTGLALLALANESDLDGRIRAAVDFLLQSVSERATTSSLSYGLIGLSAHGVTLPHAQAALASAVRRTNKHHGSPAQLALALLAMQEEDSLLVRMARNETFA